MVSITAFNLAIIVVVVVVALQAALPIEAIDPSLYSPLFLDLYLALKYPYYPPIFYYLYLLVLSINYYSIIYLAKNYKGILNYYSNSLYRILLVSLLLLYTL